MSPEAWMELGLIAGYGVVTFALWRTPVLFPFKLITIYIHELGHALAGVLTGAKIQGIEVNANEGGACHLTGGNMWLILPAGYLGSSIFGSTLILLSIIPSTAKIAAVVVCVALALALWWAKNWLLRGLTIGFFVLIGLTWWFKEGVGLRYLIGFLGTMSALYAVYDIYDDTIRREIKHSDASYMAEKTGIPSIVWGILWCLFSCVLLSGAVYMGMRLKT